MPEIERFFHRIIREACNNNMSENHALKEYVMPSTEEPRVIIVHPTVDANNYELKPSRLN